MRLQSFSLSRHFTLRLVMLVLLWLLVAANYWGNFLHLAPQHLFENWQTNGQARVLGGIVADAHGLDKGDARMGKIYRPAVAPADVTEHFTDTDTYKVFRQFPGRDAVAFVPYHTQFGLQEIVYSVLYRHFGLTRLSQLQAVSAGLTAASVTGLFVLFWRLYTPAFAALFLFCVTCPPLMLTMGRNLYWSPVLLFLPSITAALMYLAKSPRQRALWLGLTAVAMFLKSLSNYEYITCVTVLAASVFLVAPLFGRDPARRRPLWGGALMVFCACVAGFLVALLIHAGTRGDGILDGLHHIYVEDIARRTYGDPSLVPAGETRQSLRATPLDVLRIYLFEYPGRSMMLVPGKAFLAMIVLCLFGLIHKGLRRHPDFWRDLMTFFVFAAVPVSWFVFAKGHSFTQTHINFVLWFIGFMPALIYVSASTLRGFSDELMRRHRA